MSEFSRGARVRPKPVQQKPVPISEKISTPEFFAIIGITAVQDYKIRDREAFLRWCGNAFDVAIKHVQP